MISMNRTSFLDCKHKHMIKSGAPLDEFRVLYRLLPIELAIMSKLQFLSHKLGNLKQISNRTHYFVFIAWQFFFFL